MGQGEAEALGECGRLCVRSEGRPPSGEWVLRKPMRQAWIGLGGMGRKALRTEGRRQKYEKDASQTWKAQCRQRWYNVGKGVPRWANTLGCTEHLPVLLARNKEPNP